MYRLFALILLLMTFHNTWAVDVQAESAPNSSLTRSCGYKPASFLFRNTLVSQRKHMMATPLCVTANDFNVITELPLIKMWPTNEVYNQGQQGSCTANSAAFCMKYLSLANSPTPANFTSNPYKLEPSRSYLYWNNRFIDGILAGQTLTPENATDSGASIAASILALDKYGACPESVSWNEGVINTPFLSGIFTYGGMPYSDLSFKVPPSLESVRIAFDSTESGLNPGGDFTPARQIANPYPVVSQKFAYHDLATRFQKSGDYSIMSPQEQKTFTTLIINALKNGHPVMSGIMLDDTFQTGQNGYIPTPNPTTFQATGGHAISIVGYGPYNQHEPSKRYFKFMNSWGAGPDGWTPTGTGYLEDVYFANARVFGVEAYEVWFNK